MMQGSKRSLAQEALDDWLQPAHCALLVVDLQRWYVDPAECPFPRLDEEWPGNALDAIQTLIDSARAAGVPIAWTRGVEGAPESPPVLADRWGRMPEEPRLLAGSPGWDWTPVAPAAGEVVVDKIWPDACTSSGLTEWLHSHAELKAVVLVGAYAARCVLATAHGLVSLGYVPLVPDGLIVPHPDCPQEAEVAQHVVATSLGYVLPPGELTARWALLSMADDDRRVHSSLGATRSSV